MISTSRFLFLVLIFALSCSPKSTVMQVENQDNIPSPLISIGNNAVYGDEFLHMLSKNREFKNSENKISEAEFQENMDLFINYKLKVKEAESLGLDRTEEFAREFEVFKDDLTQPFLIKNSLQEGELMKAYNRMKEIVKASHILLQFPPNASQADSVSVLRMALKLKEEAEKGADFNELAFQHSDDPSAKENRGSLGYFTALQMVSAFEDAAFSMQIGQISDPIITSFGYHIIKLEDRQPNPGEVKVSHILVRSQGNDPVTEERILRRVSEIYTELQKPESSWEEICNLYSEDSGTKNSGGSLPWIGLGSVIPEFERAAFSLQEEGEISPPVKTPFGYHIIRLEDKKPLASYEEMESSIKSRILRDSRSTLIQSQVIAIQKSKYLYVENEIFVDSINSLFSSTARQEIANTIETKNLLDSILFSINKTPNTVKGLLDFIQEDRQVVRTNTQNYFKTWFDKFVEVKLQEAEINDLMTNNEEYRLMIQEYRDGILLFSLMNEQVWQKAIEDSVGQVAFYQENVEKYQWNERVQALIVTMAKEESIPSVRRFLADKKYQPNLVDRLENTFLLNNPLAFTISEGIYEWQQHPILKNADLTKNFQELRLENKTYMVVFGEKVLPGPKKFEETRGKVIQDYQEYLDKKLIASLKEKYVVEINEEEKQKIFDLAVEK
ncbi:peptidylprolyl isomerase [Aquiflexum sp. TKW24L]|uniref:peptidylprolyl isomerase n=1 Tax=Aquiflexum sp. TKW24L TaxID=2942212 RepID=UPI0020BDF341|nr:peptidylprolyl isomerase [Aquiflexum sp. TKW24L]MCL6259181.1 peptidylprolyl isomerase [Aquiflexum sp. TKW24L]